jgi:hypothetical protein
MKLVLVAAVACAVGIAAAQSVNKKTGLPDPPKPDLPYIIHASSLVETERNEAKEETRKDDKLYAVAGASSGARTPLASPEFLLQAESVPPDHLQLFKLEVRAGRREVVVTRKKKAVAKPLQLSVFQVDQKLKLFRIRVDESLTAGEYCLTPEGSNTIFGFTVE